MTRRSARRDDRPGDGRIKHMRMQEVIKTADWVIDLGPEGGDKGGEIVAEGTPEDVAGEARSYTGAYLQDILARSERVESGPAIKLGKTQAKAPKREREAAE